MTSTWLSALKIRGTEQLLLVRLIFLRSLRWVASGTILLAVAVLVLLGVVEVDVEGEVVVRLVDVEVDCAVVLLDDVTGLVECCSYDGISFEVC